MGGCPFPVLDKRLGVCTLMNETLSLRPVLYYVVLRNPRSITTISTVQRVAGGRNKREALATNAKPLKRMKDEIVVGGSYPRVVATMSRWTERRKTGNMLG